MFEKRFEIYNFVVDLWYIVGYFEGAQGFNKKQKHSYNNIISFVEKSDLSEDISTKIKHAYENSNKFKRMQSCLFSGKVGKYLENLLSNFSIYIHGIYHKNSIAKKLEESAYKKILDLHKTEQMDMHELKQYIDLSDIKRLDI